MEEHAAITNDFFSFTPTTIIVDGFQLLTLGLHQLQENVRKILLQKSIYKQR